MDVEVTGEFRIQTIRALTKKPLCESNSSYCRWERDI